MSSPSHRQPRRLFALIALAGVLLILAVIASLSMRQAAPSSVGQATLASATSTAAPQSPRRLRATITVMPAAPTRRVTRTPAPTSPPMSLAALFPTATPGVTEIFTCTETVGTVLDDMWPSRISGGEERYLIYLPPCYEPNARFRYPTLYLLHGINSDDTFWESLGVFEKMDEGLRANKFAPALIVSVDGNYALFLNTSGGPGSYEAQIVEELVPTIDRLYRTSNNRLMRAIGGISRGGVWSLEIGFRNPDLFGVVAGHSPCLHYNEAPFMLDPLKMNSYLSLNRQRIWLDAGDQDGCLLDTEDMHTVLDGVGVSHTFTIWPGQHEASYWAAHLDDYLAFYTQAWAAGQAAAPRP